MAQRGSWLWAPVTALVLVASLGAARSSAAADALVLGAEDDWAPYAYRGPKADAPQGLAPRIVREALATQGLQVRFVTLPFARCMHLAEHGEIDGCFNATIVDHNRALYHWHATPMFEEELAIFGRADARPSHELGLEDLVGKRVGFTVGYTYPTSFRMHPGIERISVKSDAVLLEMLAARRVDYILINTAPAMLRLRGEPRFEGRLLRVGRISMDGFWLAFSRKPSDGEERARRFEQGLAALRASGRHQQLLDELRRELKY